MDNPGLEKFALQLQRGVHPREDPYEQFGVHPADDYSDADDVADAEASGSDVYRRPIRRGLVPGLPQRIPGTSLEELHKRFPDVITPSLERNTAPSIMEERSADEIAAGRHLSSEPSSDGPTRVAQKELRTPETREAISHIDDVLHGAPTTSTTAIPLRFKHFKIDNDHIVTSGHNGNTQVVERPQQEGEPYVLHNKHGVFSIDGGNNMLSTLFAFQIISDMNDRHSKQQDWNNFLPQQQQRTSAYQSQCPVCNCDYLEEDSPEHMRCANCGSLVAKDELPMARTAAGDLHDEWDMAPYEMQMQPDPETIDDPYMNALYGPGSTIHHVDPRSPQYDTDYERGWQQSQKKDDGEGRSPLDELDDANASHAAYDGYEDYAVDRPKWAWRATHRRGLNHPDELSDEDWENSEKVANVRTAASKRPGGMGPRRPLGDKPYDPDAPGEGRLDLFFGDPNLRPVDPDAEIEPHITTLRDDEDETTDPDAITAIEGEHADQPYQAPRNILGSVNPGLKRFAARYMEPPLEHKDAFEKDSWELLPDAPFHSYFKLEPRTNLAFLAEYKPDDSDEPVWHTRVEHLSSRGTPEPLPEPLNAVKRNNPLVNQNVRVKLRLPGHDESFSPDNSVPRTMHLSPTADPSGPISYFNDVNEHGLNSPMLKRNTIPDYAHFYSTRIPDETDFPNHPKYSADSLRGQPFEGEYGCTGSVTGTHGSADRKGNCPWCGRRLTTPVPMPTELSPSDLPTQMTDAYNEHWNPDDPEDYRPGFHEASVILRTAKEERYYPSRRDPEGTAQWRRDWRAEHPGTQIERVTDQGLVHFTDPDFPPPMRTPRELAEDPEDYGGLDDEDNPAYTFQPMMALKKAEPDYAGSLHYDEDSDTVDNNFTRMLTMPGHATQRYYQQADEARDAGERPVW